MLNIVASSVVLLLHYSLFVAHLPCSLRGTVYMCAAKSTILVKSMNDCRWQSVICQFY